jgi:hypothetical protein
MFLVEKAAGLAIEGALGAAARGALAPARAASLCREYRRVAVCRLLATGEPDGFLEFLVRSAQAHLHALERTPEDRKLTSLSLPFLDAVAAGAGPLAREIAARTRTTWSRGEEYEDDFLYFHLLAQRFGLGRSTPALAGDVARLEALGGEDGRAALLLAILRADQAALEAALEAFVEARRAEEREARSGGWLSAEDAATFAKVSVELLALLRLAEAAGLTAPRNVPLAPSTVRVCAAPPLDADAWRRLPSYRSFR